MILIFERDVRKHINFKKSLKPSLFVGSWNSGKTWRVGWINWSLSYYPEPGLRDFFNTIEQRTKQWSKK